MTCGVTVLIASSVAVFAESGSASTVLVTNSANAGSRILDHAMTAKSLKGVKIDFATSTSAGAVYVDQEAEFAKQARLLGAKVSVYNNQGDATTMISNASLMVANKPAYIIEYPSAASATPRVGQIFGRAHIRCFAINVPVPGCSLFNFDQPYLANLGAKVIAADMAKRGWTPSNTTVVIGQASELGPSVNIAVTSFYAALSNLVPGMTPVKARAITPTTTTINSQGLQVDMGLTNETGDTSMLTALSTIPKGNNIVVYTVNDDTTVGVQLALAAQGRTATSMVSGYGGGPQALTQLRQANSSWVSDQMGFFDYWGEFVLAMVAASRDGLKIPALTSPPMVVMTPQNVNKYFTTGTDKLISMPALPKSSTYLLKTGILQRYHNVQGAL